MGVVPTLPRSRPSKQGVSARGFLEFLDSVERAGIELHSLMALRHGYVVAEGWWAPYAPDTPHLLYSLSKSFTSVAAGLAVEDGLLAVDDKLLTHLAEFAPPDIDDRFLAVTVDHALRMATGHLDDTVMDVISWCAEHRDSEWLHAMFTLPPERPVGTLFAYDQLATYAVARIVQRATGKRLVDFLGPRLFEPLEITEQVWMSDADGHDWGFSGLHLTTESVAAFGQLCLQGGTWRGRQLIDADWLRTATSGLTRNDAVHRGDPTRVPNPDWACGYGYQFWRSRHGYRGDGAYGQFCLVLPDQDAIVVLTSATDRMQELLDLVWRHLLVAFAAPDAPCAAEVPRVIPPDMDDELAGRLGGLALPLPATDGRGRPGSFTSKIGGDAGMVTAVELRQTGEDYVVDLTLDGALHSMPIGNGRWLTGHWPTDPPIPFVSAGGWRDGRFAAELRMIRTPHVLLLVLDPTAHAFDLRWREPLLHVPDHTVYAV